MKSRPLSGSANVNLLICTDPLGKGKTRSMTQYDEIVKHLIDRFADEFVYGYENGNMVTKMNL